MHAVAMRITHTHTMHLWLQADVRWAHSGASIRIPPDRRCDLISIHRSKHSPFHLSPAFTLSAGHKTIAPARHRMAHVQRRPAGASSRRTVTGQWPAPRIAAKFPCRLCIKKAAVPPSTYNASPACGMDAAVANVRRENDS